MTNSEENQRYCSLLQTHLSVIVVAGICTQDAADLHIGKPLLQHLNYITNAQLSTSWHSVKHLMRTI